MATLKAQHLAKAYKSRQVVRDVSLSIDGGQIVGLLGPNGAGKTTCFYMMVGMVKANSGRIFIDEEDITRLPIYQRARRGMGYLAQEAGKKAQARFYFEKALHYPWHEYKNSTDAKATLALRELK